MYRISSRPIGEMWNTGRNLIERVDQLTLKRFGYGEGGRKVELKQEGWGEREGGGRLGESKVSLSKWLNRRKPSVELKAFWGQMKLEVIVNEEGKMTCSHCAGSL